LLHESAPACVRVHAGALDIHVVEIRDLLQKGGQMNAGGADLSKNDPLVGSDLIRELPQNETPAKGAEVMVPGCLLETQELLFF
jgi:hypothetical protein